MSSIDADAAADLIGASMIQLRKAVKGVPKSRVRIVHKHAARDVMMLLMLLEEARPLFADER